MNIPKRILEVELIFRSSHITQQYSHGLKKCILTPGQHIVALSLKLVKSNGHVIPECPARSRGYFSTLLNRKITRLFSTLMLLVLNFSTTMNALSTPTRHYQAYIGRLSWLCAFPLLSMVTHTCHKLLYRHALTRSVPVNGITSQTKA